MSDYQINFGARKGETLVTEKSTAKSQQQNCTTKPIESTDWNPMHPINFKSLSFAVPWSQRFFLNFPRVREPRSGECELRSGEKKKPLVTLDLNLTFMQTLGS